MYAIVQPRNIVTNAIVGGEGRRIPGPAQSHSERNHRIQFVGIVSVEFKVMPPTERRLVMVNFGVASKWYVFEEQLGDGVAGVRARTTILGNAVSALSQFVLDIVACQTAKLEIVGTGYLGEVVFPNEEVFVILPRRLMPKSRISISTPVCRQAHACRFREDCRKLRRDVVIQGLARFVGRDLNVVAGARELELVDRGRTQGGRKLDCEAVAGLIPIRG